MDLHTHFTGCLTGDDLVEIALKHKPSLALPLNDLVEMGIRADSLPGDMALAGKGYTEQEISHFKSKNSLPINGLSEEQHIKIASSLSFKPDEISTFAAMEDCYRWRDPFVKDIELFPACLKRTAEKYAEDGVDYAELSFNKILDPKWHEAAIQHLPKIEEETGTRMTFLAGWSRHQCKEWYEDKVNALKTMSESPYVAGIDMLAQETNSTRDFANVLHEVFDWASNNGNKMPGFTVRVHAGENEHHPENVRQALEIASLYILNEDGSPKADTPMVRVGHGIYGLDAETLALAKQLSDAGKVVFESCVDSNKTLNNIDNVLEASYRTLVEQGINALPGTDSPGMYRTTQSQVVDTLSRSGADIDLCREITGHAENIVRNHTEEAFAYKMQKLQQKTREIMEKEGCTEQQARGTLFKFEFTPVCTDDVEESYKRKNQIKEGIITGTLEKMGISFNDEQLQNAIAGKKPILMFGSLDAETPEVEAAVQQQIRNIIKNIDPLEHYIVTSGNGNGVQGIINQELKALKESGQDIPVTVGAFSLNIKDTPDCPEVMDFGKIVGKKWFDLPPKIVPEVIEKEGIMIGFGGNLVHSDMVAIAHNTKMSNPDYKGEIILVKDINGKCADKAEAYANYNYGVDLENVSETVKMRQIMQTAKKAVQTIQEQVVHRIDTHAILPQDISLVYQKNIASLATSAPTLQR